MMYDLNDLKKKMIEAQEELSIFSTDIAETDEIPIPNDLFVFANKYAENEREKLLPKKMSGETFLKLMNGEELTLRAQAQRNLILSYREKGINGTTILPIIPNEESILNDLLKLETSNMNLVGTLFFPNIEIYLKNFETPKCLEGWLKHLKIYNIKNEVINVIEKIFEKSEKINEHLFRPKHIIDQCRELKRTLEKTDFMIINGPAGSGKSTYVMEHLSVMKKKKIGICTLSNTIGLMFKEKMLRKGINIDFFSITKVKYAYENNLKKNTLKNYDVVIIDEASQWGVESLDILIKILKNNENAKFYFMGDVNQIPTFLSSGSIFYSMMETFPEKTKVKQALYRFQDEEKMRKVIKGDEINVKIYSPDVKLFKEAECIITGTNKHVAEMNRLMMKVKFGVDILGLELGDTLRRIEEPIQIICTTTKKINGHSIYRNERFTAYALKNGEFKIKSLVQGWESTIDIYTLNYTFTYAYAITVNKSQGLEWDNTVIFMNNSDRNLFNHNALYVAISRSKTGIIIISNDGKRKITEKDVNKILKKNYKYENLLTF